MKKAISIQWFLYFKTTHGTKEMWSCIAGGLKIKTHLTKKIALWNQIKQSYNLGGLKIQGCKIEGLLYLLNKLSPRCPSYLLCHMLCSQM